MNDRIRNDPLLAAMERLLRSAYVDIPANRQAIQEAEAKVHAYLPGIGYQDMTEPQREGLHALENEMFEIQMMTFRESVFAGDSDASRKAFFGADYPVLLKQYEWEEAEDRKPIGYDTREDEGCPSW